MMNTDTRTAVPTHLRPLASLAALFERLENQPREAGAQQYRLVARQIGELLALAEADPFLDRMLTSFPATAELYENQHYDQAGLCRSPQTLALSAELSAAAAIRRAKSTR